MYFHTQLIKGILTTCVIHRLATTYFWVIKFLRNVISSKLYLLNHFFSKLLLCNLRFLIPKSPCLLFKVRTSHLTRLKPLLSLLPCHKKSLFSLLIFFSTPLGIGEIAIYVGRTSNTELMRVRLPPKDKY